MAFLQSAASTAASTPWWGAGLFGLLGAAIGSVVTAVFASRREERSHRLEREMEERAIRRSAYIEFMNHCRTLYLTNKEIVRELQRAADIAGSKPPFVDPIRAASLQNELNANRLEIFKAQRTVELAAPTNIGKLAWRVAERLNDYNVAIRTVVQGHLPSEIDGRPIVDHTMLFGALRDYKLDTPTESLEGELLRLAKAGLGADESRAQSGG